MDIIEVNKLNLSGFLNPDGLHWLNMTNPGKLNYIIFL
jgi:hypothetical protein